jgi:hypothetical protein
MTMDSAQHNRLWERFLAALAARHALPVQTALGNHTPTEIARFADAKLETDLAVSFVEYYLEQRYSGTSSRLSEAEAEALILQIEALPVPSSSQPAPIAQRSDRQPPASVESKQTTFGTAVLKPAVSESALDESLPVGTEFLPKSQPAPKPAKSAPPPKPRPQPVAAPAVAVKPKPQKPVKSKKRRPTARELLTDLGRGLAKMLGGGTLLIALIVTYGLWGRWTNTTHWKLQSAGDSTYITGLSDVDRKASKDPPRQKLSIGCENGRDFVRIVLPTDPENRERDTSERLYFQQSIVRQSPNDTHSTTQVRVNHLVMQPAPGNSPAPEFEVVSQILVSDYDFYLANHPPGNLDEARRQLSKPFSVSEFLSTFSRSNGIALWLERYDSQGHYWEPNNDIRFGPGGLYDNDIRFGPGGLAKHLPELAEACHWNLAQNP